MVEIRRVGIFSFALMVGLLYTAFGVLVGLLFACVSILGITAMGAAMEDLTGVGASGVVVGLVYAVCMPILYGALGFIGGAIIGALYNLIAGVAGGIKVELAGLNTAKPMQ